MDGMWDLHEDMRNEDRAALASSKQKFKTDEEWDSQMDWAIDDVMNIISVKEVSNDASNRTIHMEMTDSQFLNLQAILHYYTNCLEQEVDQEFITKSYPEIGECLREAEVLKKLYNIDEKKLRELRGCQFDSDNEWEKRFHDKESEVTSKDNLWYERP